MAVQPTTRYGEQVGVFESFWVPMARLSAALVLLYMLVAAPAHAAGMTEKSDVTIPASDGVNLVGDVYLPGDGKARYPPVVDMEPSGRSMSTDYGPEGYARINTDVRGSGKSGGARGLLSLPAHRDVLAGGEWVA